MMVSDNQMTCIVVDVQCMYVLQWDVVDFSIYMSSAPLFEFIQILRISTYSVLETCATFRKKYGAPRYHICH
jgi:hypothetical protein